MSNSLTTPELVDKIFIFCEAYAYGSSGKYFYPYQAQLSKRVIRSLLDNDGEEITAQQSRQSGKSEVVAITVGGCAILLPVLANMPVFADDLRLSKFKFGLLIGIFAPAQQQSQIIFNRIKQYMGTDSGIAVMQDPDINVTFAANNGINLVLRFNNLNITSTITCMSASEGSNIEGKTYMLIVVDEAQDVGNFKYSKSISPMCSFYNGTKVLIGTPTTFKGFFYEAIERNKFDFDNKTRKRNHFQYNWEFVAQYNTNYAKYVESEKRRLGEDSDEFQMSYNLKWILERGMFTTTSKFDALGVKTMGICSCDYTNEHVAGIDYGKKNDSTVVTVGEVDWENPIIVEQNKSDDPSVEDYIVYDVYVKAWLELQGDDWNSQYIDIMAFLNNYNIRRLVCDATGVGAGVTDRIRANVSYEVIDYVFSTPSKSELYKHYDAEIKAGRLHYPKDAHAQETREYERFIEQHLDLQKGYSGQHMIVCHPDDKSAHDDYPDSCAMMVWGAKGEGVSRPEATEESIYREVNQSAYYNQRNTVTARRR